MEFRELDFADMRNGKIWKIWDCRWAGGRRCWPVAAAAMRPGPPVQPSRRRPPRRQEVPQERNRRHRLDQPQPLRSRSCGNRSRALLVLLLLASSPLVLGLAEPPGLPGAEWQQALLSRQTYPKSTVTRAIQPRKQQNLTIGYLTAIKGGLKDRQGLAISGAFSMALDEVSSSLSSSSSVF